MPTFEGHVLPGSFFIVFGVWWWFHILDMIAKAQTRFLKHRDRRRGNNFESNLDFVSTTWQKVPVPYLRAVPVEPSLKVIATTFAIIKELCENRWRLTDEHGNFIHLMNFDHSTMYAIFLLQAVVEILNFYSTLFLPAATDHVLASLAFFCHRRIVLLSHRRTFSSRSKGAHFYLHTRVCHLDYCSSWSLATQQFSIVYGAYNINCDFGDMVHSNSPCSLRNPPLERHSTESKICHNYFFMAHHRSVADISL